MSFSNIESKVVISGFSPDESAVLLAVSVLFMKARLRRKTFLMTGLAGAPTIFK